MKCPKCNREVGQVRKYKIHECVCGGKLMCIEINKIKRLVDVKGEK